MNGLESDFLHELDVEVEADISMDAAGTPPEGDPWLLDPYEAQAESADLNSLRGAIQALEPYAPTDE